MDERKIIDLGGEMGEQFGHPTSRLTVLFKLEWTTHTAMGKGKSTLQLTGYTGIARDRFAVQFAQARFVFERIHLRHAALHKEEDAMLGFTRQLLPLRLQGIRRHCASSHQIIHQQSAKTHRPDTVPSTMQKVAPVHINRV
jgi:hypothetical protein